jgi:hypothetical protein
VSLCKLKGLKYTLFSPFCFIDKKGGNILAYDFISNKAHIMLIGCYLKEILCRQGIQYSSHNLLAPKTLFSIYSGPVRPSNSKKSGKDVDR